MREHPNYRDELELILRFTGGKSILSISDVSTYTGKCRKWCREKLELQGEVTAVDLAKRLAARSGKL